jgi:hypothetical protein
MLYRYRLIIHRKLRRPTTTPERRKSYAKTTFCYRLLSGSRESIRDLIVNRQKEIEKMDGKKWRLSVYLLDTLVTLDSVVNLPEGMKAMSIDTPWAILLCKFKDDLSDFPTPLQLYEKLFTTVGDGTYNVLKYFNDVSHGILNLRASQIFGPIIVDVNHFDYTPSGDPGWVQKVDRNTLLERIKSAAQGSGIPLNQFSSRIVAIFNVAIGGSFGGTSPSPHAIADDRFVRDNGTPDFAHEMGHGYGLDHNRLGAVDEPPGEKYDYQDPWDIMSYNNGTYTAPDPDYKWHGPGLNAWDMRGRGWLDESRVWRASSATFDEIVQLRPLMRYDLPGLLAAELPPNDSSGHGRYLVEFCMKEGWNAGIPRSSILVHRFSQNHSYLMTGVRAGRLLNVAQTTPNGDFGDWSQLGDAVGVGQMMVISGINGGLEIFAVDTGAGFVWTNWQNGPNGDFEGWVIVGNKTGFHQVTAGRNADGRLEVFAIDSQGVPWHIAQPDPSSGFPDWSQLGDAVGVGQMMVISGINGGLEVFAVDTGAGFVWTNWQNGPNGSFEGWVVVGNKTGFRQVTAGRNADGRLEVFAVDSQGVPWHTAQPDPSSGFPDWSRLGDAVGVGQIEVGSNADGRLEVFAVDTADHLAWHTAQSAPNGDFGGWSWLRDAKGVGQIAVGSNADGRLEVFATDTAAGLAWHTAQSAPNGDFGGWSRIFDAAGLGQIAVGSNADGRLEVFSIDVKGYPDLVEGDTLDVGADGGSTVPRVEVLKINEQDQTASLRLSFPPAG